MIARVARLLAPALLLSTVPALAQSSIDSSAFRSLGWRNIGPERGGRSVGRGRLGGAPSRVLHGHHRRRGVQDHRRRLHLGAGHRQVLRRHHRGDRGLPSPIPTSCTWAGASSRSAATSPTATACSRPPTAARPGLPRPGRDPSDLQDPDSTRGIRTSCTSRRWATVFGPTPERGVYSSNDGGKTWQKILFRNDSTGAADLLMDPDDPNVLYAASLAAYRTPWMHGERRAPAAGIFKTTDGGDHLERDHPQPGPARRA